MTVSIEAQKYWGQYWLLVRTWDGIDKPQKACIFKIAPDEVEFEGGRFKRMKWTYTDKDPWLQKLIIGSELCEIEEIINWISENTVGFWNFDISLSDDCFYDGQVHDAVWIFRFKDEQDAMAFKLRWM